MNTLIQLVKLFCILLIRNRPELCSSLCRKKLLTKVYLNYWDWDFRLMVFSLFFKNIYPWLVVFAPLFCEYFKHLKTTCTRKSVILIQKKLVGDRLKDETVFFFTFFFCCRRICLNIYFQRQWTKKYIRSVENYEFRLSKLSTTFFLICYCYMQILTVLNACYMSASLFIYEYFIWLISNKLQQYCWSLGLF